MIAVYGLAPLPQQGWSDADFPLPVLFLQDRQLEKGSVELWMDAGAESVRGVNEGTLVAASTAWLGSCAALDSW